MIMKEEKFLYYKGFIGSIEFSREDNLHHGRVLGLTALISYEGQSIETLKGDFKESIEEYLEFCEGKNIKPEKSVIMV